MHPQVPFRSGHLYRIRGSGSLGSWPRIVSPVFTLLPCVLVLSVNFVGSFASSGLRYREHRRFVITSRLLRYRPRLLQSFVVASSINVSVPVLFARYVRRHSRRVFVRSALRLLRSVRVRSVIVAP